MYTIFKSIFNLRVIPLLKRVGLLLFHIDILTKLLFKVILHMSLALLIVSHMSCIRWWRSIFSGTIGDILLFLWIIMQIVVIEKIKWDFQTNHWLWKSFIYIEFWNTKEQRTCVTYKCQSETYKWRRYHHEESWGSTS